MLIPCLIDPGFAHQSSPVPLQGSVSRCPDGADTNVNGNDYAFRSTVTAGSPNSCTTAAASTGCGTTPAPGTPAPGTPAPGTPAPGTPAPGTPAPATPGPTVAAGFDFFYMVNQWPGGWNLAFCAESSWPRGAYWTLHGMWPNYNTGGYPSSCNSEVFQQSQVGLAYVFV